MNGAGIQQAKKALLIFLHSLPADCYVNVVGFGSKHHCLFPGTSRIHDDDVLKFVQLYVEVMNADLGGSESIEPALQAILELPTIDGYLRQVFVIITPAWFPTSVRQLSGKARVFAFGLGYNVSRRNIVKDIARVGNGTALFTFFEQEVGENVIRQLRDALRPSWTDIKLEWGGFGEDLLGTEPLLRQSPIPSVFSGHHLVVYGLLNDGADIPNLATLIVHTPDKAVLSIQIRLNPMTTKGLLSNGWYSISEQKRLC